MAGLMGPHADANADLSDPASPAPDLHFLDGLLWPNASEPNTADPGSQLFEGQSARGSTRNSAHFLSPNSMRLMQDDSPSLAHTFEGIEPLSGGAFGANGIFAFDGAPSGALGAPGFGAAGGPRKRRRLVTGSAQDADDYFDYLGLSAGKGGLQRGRSRGGGRANGRVRKKALAASLAREVGELVNARLLAEAGTFAANVPGPQAEDTTTRRAIVRAFLHYRARLVTAPALWAQLVDDAFVLDAPSTAPIYPLEHGPGPGGAGGAAALTAEGMACNMAEGSRVRLVGVAGMLVDTAALVGFVASLNERALARHAATHAREEALRASAHDDGDPGLGLPGTVGAAPGFVPDGIARATSAASAASRGSGGRGSGARAPPPIRLCCSVGAADVVVDGPRVMCHWVLATVGLAAFSGCGGKEVVVDGMFSCAFAGSKLVRGEMVYDVLALSRQLLALGLADRERVAAAFAPPPKLAGHTAGGAKGGEAVGGASDGKWPDGKGPDGPLRSLKSLLPPSLWPHPPLGTAKAGAAGSGRTLPSGFNAGRRGGPLWFVHPMLAHGMANGMANGTQGTQGIGKADMAFLQPPLFRGPGSGLGSSHDTSPITPTMAWPLPHALPPPPPEPTSGGSGGGFGGNPFNPFLPFNPFMAPPAPLGFNPFMRRPPAAPSPRAAATAPPATAASGSGSSAGSSCSAGSSSGTAPAPAPAASTGTGTGTGNVAASSGKSSNVGGVGGVDLSNLQALMASNGGRVPQALLQSMIKSLGSRKPPTNPAPKPK